MIGIDFRNKVALICGAGGGGIGSAVARIFAEAGATIAALDQSEELNRATRDVITGFGVRCETFVADLADPAQAAPVIERVWSRMGGIDMLVNVAGGTQDASMGPARKRSRRGFPRCLRPEYRLCLSPLRGPWSAYDRAALGWIDRQSRLCFRPAQRALPRGLRGGKGRNHSLDSNNGGRMGALWNSRERRRTGQRSFAASRGLRQGSGTFRHGRGWKAVLVSVGDCPGDLVSVVRSRLGCIGPNVDD